MSKPTHTIDAARYAHIAGPAMVSAEDLETYRRHTLEMTDKELDELIALCQDAALGANEYNDINAEELAGNWKARLEKLRG